MAILIIIVGLAIVVGAFYAVPRLKMPEARSGVAGAGLVVLALAAMLSSVRFVGRNEVGIVARNAWRPSLEGGRIIAVNGEMGVQADVLRAGWHWWYWPVLYSVRTVPLTEVKQGEIGMMEAKDGQPLPTGQVIAAEFAAPTFQKMLDARYFLTDGRGQKGTQASVLTPGKYALNTDLFQVRTLPQLDIGAGSVAVLKSNIGAEPTVRVAGPAETGDLLLAGPGERGILAAPLPPGRYPVNPQALQAITVSTQTRVAQYTASDRGSAESVGAITVKSADGFNFPIDVRVVYFIKPDHAPKVAALLGGDNERLQDLLNSRVRRIFRDGAESVKALDYVQQRSRQGQVALAQLTQAMLPYGVTVEAVDIGEVGTEQTLGELLKTQRDREIAKQEQVTVQEQQRAAEQQKQLAKTVQEADEEKRLATASYGVKIAEQAKTQRIIEAGAEAESIRIRAEAQSTAYAAIAAQIGRGNAALVEVLKIVGERGIQITPRVMVTGGGGGNGRGLESGSGQTTALIGTLLDFMVSKDEPVAVGGPVPGR